MGVKVAIVSPAKGWRPELLEKIISEGNREGIRLLLFPQDIFYDRPWKELVETGELENLNSSILNKFSELAREKKLYISPGTIIENGDEHYYRTGILFNPEGEIVLKQKQLFLHAGEQQESLAKGKKVAVVNTDIGKLGFIVGTDCWYPEVGRFLALEGADIILAPVYLGNKNEWRQLAGVWQQVQQNQFYVLEAAEGQRSMIHGPSEITPYRTGILAPVGTEKQALSEKPDVYLKALQQILQGKSEQNKLEQYKSEIRAEATKDRAKSVVKGLSMLQVNLELEELYRIRRNYPLLKLLNPTLYQLSSLDKV